MIQPKSRYYLVTTTSGKVLKCKLKHPVTYKYAYYRDYCANALNIFPNEIAEIARCDKNYTLIY